jgi:disulfide bond formation protein DsbB
LSKPAGGRARGVGPRDGAGTMGGVTHDVIVVLAALGVLGQVLVGLLVLLGLLWLAGLRRLLGAVRRAIWGYELWLAFLVAATATGGSLFFSEVAHFVPCELCWFQRICMYPLSVTTLLLALANDHRAARYLLPLPLAGAGISVYHLLVEHGVVEQTQACVVSAPGGCATKWINEFGYVTIPTLALTGFALTFACLLFAVFDAGEDGNSGVVSTLNPDG